METIGDILDTLPPVDEARRVVADLDAMARAPGKPTANPLIRAPGAYAADLVPIEAYHGREICPAPSISSSGLKLLHQRSPRHYWWQSPLNPERPEPETKRHFSIGKAVHDKLLLGSRWPAFYHILPEGFSRSKSKAMADEIAEADAAIEAGKVLLSVDDAITVNAAVKAVQADKLLARAFERGEAETTIAWQDGPTGAWLRARPDCMTPDRAIVLDIKTAENASPAAMERSIRNYGYLQSAALYLDGLEAVTGERPKEFWIVAIEKEAPYAVATYPLEPEDIARAGFHFNRPAIDTFARCLEADNWPAYPHQRLGMSRWERKNLDEKEMSDG
jgi:hypothetical protein